MTADPITWTTTHGDTVEVYLSRDLVLPDRAGQPANELQQWRYRVRAANGRIVEQGSEGYTRRHRAVRAAERHHPRLGNDGLTDAERRASAERWRSGAGRTPSKEEMDEIRRLTPVTRSDGQDLVVTDEYFDYLAEDRPARPDPALVELFRSMRGSVRQVES